MKKIFCFLSVIIFLSSCGDFQDITFEGVEKLKVNKLGKDGLDMDVTAKIKNPNRMAFTIYKSEMDVELSGMKIGLSKLNNNIKIKANSEQAYTFNIVSNFEKLNLFELPSLLTIFTKRSITVKMKGDLNVGKMFLKKKYPVDFNKNVPLSAGGFLNNAK